MLCFIFVLIYRKSPLDSGQKTGTVSSTYPRNTAAIFGIAISKVDDANSSTKSTNNIIHVTTCRQFEAVKCVVHHITQVVNCVWVWHTILWQKAETILFICKYKDWKLPTPPRVDLMLVIYMYMYIDLQPTVKQKTRN